MTEEKHEAAGLEPEWDEFDLDEPLVGDELADTAARTAVLPKRETADLPVIGAGMVSEEAQKTMVMGAVPAAAAKTGAAGDKGCGESGGAMDGGDAAADAGDGDTKAADARGGGVDGDDDMRELVAEAADAALAQPPTDGTVVMDPAALKRALARAEADADRAAEADEALKAEEKAAARAGDEPRAVINRADEEAFAIDEPLDEACGAEAAAAGEPGAAGAPAFEGTPDITAFLSPHAVAELVQKAAPVQGGTMVMRKVAPDASSSAEGSSGAPSGAPGSAAGGADGDVGSSGAAGMPDGQPAAADAAARAGAAKAAGVVGGGGAGVEAVAASPAAPEVGARPAASLASDGAARVRAGGSGAHASAVGASGVPEMSALFLSAFFDELYRMGVRDFVVSPGSRSTPLAMVAYEMSRREEYEGVRLFVDVDERGAAFFALGLGKAKGRPACAICTSGTACANYYPAVLEAESSRVPLVLLTGDRPPRLQALGAPQTCNQEKLFGDHVRLFLQMPLPSADRPSLAFARQAAREAFAQAVGAAGACAGGPVHLNFPFEEPLKPALDHPDLFVLERSRWCGAPEDAGLSPIGACVRAGGRLTDEAAATIEALLAENTAVIMAGEGSIETPEDAEALMRLAAQRSIPVLADPLSNLRQRIDELLIDHYDNIFGKPGLADFDLVVRFGRYPVSKRAAQYVQRHRPLQIVVDQLETRDFNAGTDLFVRMAPRDFVRDLNAAADRAGGQVLKEHGQERLAQAWARRNEEERARVGAVREVEAGFEGAYVSALLDELPDRSLLFAANSMSIRAVDTFCDKGARFDILGNRGLNGIDGTLSTALGAAQAYRQATLLIGDLSLLHDVSAFALNAELMRVHREAGELAPSFVIVLLNNHGGGIFDMLPQKSEDAYFERLFLTPEHADFGQIAAAFDVPYARVVNVADFRTAYRALVGRPGMSLLEVDVPLQGLKERYADYQ